jgi:hypothetical protein
VTSVGSSQARTARDRHAVRPPIGQNVRIVQNRTHKLQNVGARDLARRRPDVTVLAERDTGTTEATLDVLGAEERVRVVAVVREPRPEEVVRCHAQQVARRVGEPEIGPGLGEQGREIHLRARRRHDLVPVDASLVGAHRDAHGDRLNPSHELRLENHLSFAPIDGNCAMRISPVGDLLDGAGEEDRSPKEENVAVLDLASNVGVVQRLRGGRAAGIDRLGHGQTIRGDERHAQRKFTRPLKAVRGRRQERIDWERRGARGG